MSATISPNGCRWCGKESREHSIEWSAKAGYHNYAAPSPAAILARMRERRRSTK